MTYRMRRLRLSAAERTELWARWKQGERLSDIAAALGRAPATVYARIRKAGGIPERRRAGADLPRAGGGAGGAGDRPGTGARPVDREPGDRAQRRDGDVSGGPGRAGRVAPGGAPQALQAGAAAPPASTGGGTNVEACWSPLQIAGWLQRTFPTEPALLVSHETIYQTLFVQARGALKRELTAYLRTGRRERGRRRMPAEIRGTIPGAVSIRERPPTVEARAILGYWEGYLLIRARQGSTIATLVERSTRDDVLAKLASRSADHLLQRLQRQMQHLPA
jgi:IS30 family transposase